MKSKEDILAKWLNGEVSDDELETLEGSAALQELKQVIQEVGQWSMPKYNTDAGYNKMKERLQDKNRQSRGLKWLKLIAIVSMIGLLVYGFLSFFGTQREKIKAEYGEKINFAFQDGSEVWLNDGSSIEYKTSDWSTERTIKLQGEALFEVRKGSPFTVHTTNGIVTVLGTQFNVRAWGNNLYVECYEGKVQVALGDQRTILTAKEGVYVIDGSMTENQVINNTTSVWLNGMSRFYDDKLSIICDELERQYQIDVDLRAADRYLSGIFNHDDIDQALRSICIPLGLSYTLSQDKKSVVIE